MLNELAKQIHEDAKRKGFWDKPYDLGRNLMMVITELSEAVDADREDNYIDAAALDALDNADWREFPALSTDIYLKGVKDSFEAELCDALMRLLDTMAYCNVDADRIIKNAMEYNRLRPDKNGKKY